MKSKFHAIYGEDGMVGCKAWEIADLQGLVFSEDMRQRKRYMASAP
ncbi:MAG: hypothetical protein HZB81_03960 [Deltaproteobacteria bacterium]|nr:hypothetical protein [Deltaproteobacteria bacterium]